MIVYDYSQGYVFSVLGHTTGSTLFSIHSLPYALVSGLLAVLLDFLPGYHEYNKNRLLESGVFFSSVGFIVAFIVVYRSQLAYARFASAVSNHASMVSRTLRYESQPAFEFHSHTHTHTRAHKCARAQDCTTFASK